jgi:alpha-tubulin suppressor-like RCC1 family protein
MSATPHQVHARRLWWSAVAFLAIACKGTEPPPPTTGAVQVTAATAGADLDADGYIVVLDSSAAALPVGVNGSTMFSDLSPGSHQLTLVGTAVNCPVVGDNPRTVSVTLGRTTQITFQITCVQRVDLAGVWNYTEQFGSPLACNDTGSIVVTQSGDGFTGTSDQVGTCDRQEGAIDNSFSAPVSGSALYSASGGVSVSFSSGGCSYAAAIAGTPPDRLINGHVDCGSGSGTWAAVRGGGPIASVTVSPPTRSVVAGGTTQLRAVLIDASGSRRVGPTVTWTSDASGVATVDAAGVVSGVAPGSATITAAAESKSGIATVGVEVVTFTAVQAGAYHSCGLATTGVAYCWGNGTYGALGNGAKANGFAPVAVAGGSTFTALSVGAVHSCGITASGAAYCWGSNYWGELGAVTPGASLCGSDAILCSTTPVAVTGGLDFSSVSAGWTLSCALTPSGAAYCWGDDTYGELGDGSTAATGTPVTVTGGLTFVSVGTGNLFACGLTAAGAAYCWGNNTAGQLGIGPSSPKVCSGEPCSTAPVAVSGGLTFASISVGYWHVCGLASDGATYCWGDNVAGQLGATTTATCAGLGSVVDCSTLPLPVEGGPSFAKVSAGSFHSCAFTAAGDGYCWGSNDYGQLGDGTGTDMATPAAIAGGLSFAGLSAFGRWHSCGLSAASVAYCWGGNFWGQVGGASDYLLQPAIVPGQAAVSATPPRHVSQAPRATARSASPRLSPRPPRP